MFQCTNNSNSIITVSRIDLTTVSPYIYGVCIN